MASSSFSSSTSLLLLLITATALLFLFSNASALSSTCNFPALFNFGDSNSDTRGLSAAFGPAPPPNGETFFGSPTGRYSDGWLIVDLIAQSIGLPYLNAYPDSVGTNFSHGANFATAGSTIRMPNQTLFQSGFSPFSLDVQWWQFSQFKSRSRVAYEKVFKDLPPRQDYSSRALYTFDIGQNDLTSGYFHNMKTEEVKAYIPDVLDKFSQIIMNICGVGGRFFWIHNTGPFGCLLYVMDRVPLTAAQVDPFGCGAPFNEVAHLFNRTLKDAVAQLRKKPPLATITYVNVYSKYSLITQAEKHGFDHPFMACCGHGGRYNYNIRAGCGGKIKVNGTEVLIRKSCEKPAKRISWDSVHYTEAANKWVFGQISTDTFSNTPVPITMACHKQVQ